MWGAQGWNQWALQPAMFNDVPHEQTKFLQFDNIVVEKYQGVYSEKSENIREIGLFGKTVDWAALAKQWIQMQQTQPPDPSVPPVIPPVPPPASASSAVPPPSVIHPPPPGHSLVPEEFPSEASVSAPLLKTPVVPGALPEPFQNDRPFESESGNFMPKAVSNTYWNKSQWETSAANDIDERIWPVPPPIESTSSMIAGKETYDYGHMHDNPPLAMQSIDYNHMSEFSYNQVYPPENQYDQYWSQVNAAPPITPMFLKKEHTTTTTTSTPSTSLPVEDDTSQIDAAKRKQLPAWIREGLEKMEQERIKKLEKEKAEKEKAEKLAQAALKKDLDLKDVSNPIPVKSKFESDSEGDVEEENVSIKRQNSILKRSPSPVEDIRTEEEKRQEYMLALRRILTEILLSVTNAEMYSIAEEVLRKEKLKARQLASTATLTSVASGLRGLASYGTESEASEAEEEKDASDSDEELIRRIKEKKRLFAIKEKKILAELERRELEEQNEALKAKTETVKSVENESTEPENSMKDTEVSNSNEEMNSVSFIPPSDVSDRASPIIPFINEKVVVEKPVEETDANVSTKEPKKANNNKDSHSSDSSSSSSESESESSERNRKKSSKSKRNDVDRAKGYRKDKSPSKKHHKHSSDSDSSYQHHKSRSYDKSSKKSASYKKKKKYKRSDSSSSSGSSPKRRKSRSSKSESRHTRERRSRSYDDRDRKHRQSGSPKNSRSSRDSRRSRDSYSHRYDKDKYKRDKEDKYYYDYKRSPSPSRRSSKLPKKYRSSRSLSSESETSGRKMKKSRAR